MPSLVERPPSSQEALLQLEKGTASPITQLNEAAQIIGLDLSLCASHPDINRTPHPQIHAVPKEEWVLRWLLKKLKTGKNYRVEPASFLLLRQLVDLIPPKTLATTLKDQKFLGIFDHVITDLKDDVFASLRNGVDEPLPSDSESSRTLSDSSRPNGGFDKKGTKRKRISEDNQDAMGIDEQPRNLASCFLSFTRALDCIYSLAMLSTQVAGSTEASGSHLRHALRGEPQSVAGTLGKSFAISSTAITRFSQGGNTTDLQHLLFVLPALFELWEWRSLRQDSSGQTLSNESFAVNCSQRALRLLHCVRSVQLDTDEKAQVLNGVERLIALHVVLPARADFYARGGAGIDYTAKEPDWSSVKPISDTFRPILCKAESTSWKKCLWNTADLLPELFDVATRSVPRDTFRRQTHEAPWLETLFVAVAELAFSVVKSEGTPTFLSEFVRVLEQLLRVVLSRKVQLSLHTLLTHAAYTGLVKDGLSQVEWALTALFIELGVDIFLPNSGLSDASKYLEALLEKIMLHWRSGMGTDESYKVIKNGIVIPLLKGFTSARDLATFMELWYRQLTDIEEARLQDNSLAPFTVWEDNDVCNVFGDLMRNPLNHGLANTQLHAAASIIHAESKISSSAEAFAQVVILESGFRNRAIDVAHTNEDLLSIVQCVISTLSSKQPFHWRWRLWRLVRNLFENNAHTPQDRHSVDIIELADVAAKLIHRNHKDQAQRLCVRLECFEAYQLFLAIMKQHLGSSKISKFNSLLADVAKFTKSISSQDALQSMNSPWDGRLETIDSPSSLALAYFIALVQVPDVWTCIDSEVRKSLLGCILYHASVQCHTSPLALELIPVGAQFSQAWASVVCHEYLLNSPIIVADLISVVSDQIKEEKSHHKFYIESLQRIPTVLITRRQRGLLLDLLQGLVLQQDGSPENTVGLLSLMAKLAEMPKSVAELTSNWEPIWTLAKLTKLQGTETDLDIMRAYRQLHQAVVEKLLVASEEERNKLFKKMYKKVTGKASKLRSIDRDSMECFFLRVSLSQFWLHQNQLAAALDRTDLATYRKNFFELIVADVRLVKDQCKKQKLEETITLIKTLDALEDFEDLATDHKEVRKFLSTIENYVEKSVDVESSLARVIKRRVLARQASAKTLAAPMIQCAESLSIKKMYSEEQQSFIRSTSARFRSMSADALIRVVQDVRKLGFTGKNSGYHLLIVGLAVASLTPTEDKESYQAKELSMVCAAVAGALPHSKSLEQFTLAVECLDILLRNHSRCISQWNIDGLLACIAMCASKSGPRIGSEFAGTVYIRLCRLMGAILGLHRQKLGGRFHLVLPVMQRLLHCLFARPKQRNRPIGSAKAPHQQPYWLSQLQASHATHFTRLLTSLCDPTVSAVSRPALSGSSHEGLTDQTKKAKRIAGQYLQYLIMDYCQNSLHGSLSPDVKAALLPGLYSILDVVSRETMRALNAGLDISSRAVFKGLYDDYVKFGKWNKG